MLQLIGKLPYIDFPFNPIGWVGWLLLLLCIVVGIGYWWESGLFRQTWRWVALIGLLVLSPIFVLLFAIPLPDVGVIPIPGMPMESSKPVLLVLSAIPTVFAAGLLGPGAAVLVGVVSGLWLALWQSHQFFTPLEIGGMALLFSIAIRQRYRTRFFQWLRHPVFSALIVSLAFVPVFILVIFFETNGSLAVRLDYAFTQFWVNASLHGTELIIASAIGEIAFVSRMRDWGRNDPLQPAPTETNLQLRFFFGTAPFIIILLISLTVCDWVVAGKAAQQLINDRLSSTATVAAESLPYFLETGQNLIINLADPALLSVKQGESSEILSKKIRTVPYFRQLFLFGANGETLGGYPLKDIDQARLTIEEQAGIQLALKGVSIQTYTSPPWLGENTAQVSFIATIRDEKGEPGGVLFGRTDLFSNPFTQPAIKALTSLNDMNGEGMIVDENLRILFHTNPSLVMTEFVGEVHANAGFFSEVSPTGTRKFVYFAPVVGRPWRVVLSVPAEEAQKLALQIALPLLLLVVIISVCGMFALHYGLRSVTSSIQNLSKEVALISQGNLDHVLPVRGVDEVGRFAAAFEQMRASLKARLDELNRLLEVSQGVAANLEFEDAVQPVLQAAQGREASMARVALGVHWMTNLPKDKLAAYGVGRSSRKYSYLDEQIYQLMDKQDLLTIHNTARSKRLVYPSDTPTRPGAIVAVALRHENSYYGALWVGYDHAHTFTDEDIRFLSTLAGQAALAAANSSLYAKAEIGRQRMEAILASTPEPVLVIDEQMRLLLLNPAALQVPGLIANSTPGAAINEVIAESQLIELVSQPLKGQIASREIHLSNGRIYYASISEVMAENYSVGKICILRDITHYKQLDTLKSDFVATVSHDLRSPLTLMRGYATMMQMVGELNEQQKSYVKKIIVGVENMSRLVNNLLNLGRIETGVGLQVEKVNLRQVVDQVTSALTPQAIQKNINLSQEYTNEIGLEQVEADPALIQEAIYNLFENAIKYSPLGGEVGINIHFSNHDVIMKVFDHGIGIAPLDLPHVFEKFYRSGRRESYAQRGTGLGLAIVKSIVDRHQGKVWVESQLGKGSTFIIELPIVHPDTVR
jgi:signal transduction histidine kinase/HAMP domain-containing protein